MQHTPETVLKTWLNKLDIKVSSGLIKKQLKSHPDYPSLLCITDTLDHLGIENIAVEIQKDQLHEIATPFLAHVKTNGGEFVIIENRDTLEKTYPGFYKNWSGVVVAAERSAVWFHKENEELLQKEKFSDNKQYSILALLALLVTGAIAFVPGWFIPSLIAVAAAGIFVSWMIISKELGIENKITDRVCGSDNGCDKIIRTKGAKLLPGIGWSDVGIVWFSSLLIMLTLASFAGNYAGVTGLLSVLSTCAVPFIVFSLFYQWRVAKKMVPALFNNRWAFVDPVCHPAPFAYYCFLACCGDQ